ncbi:hypothetical protein EON64_10165, partial [archaeon]
MAKYLEKDPCQTSTDMFCSIEKYLLERGPGFARRIDIDEIITSVKNKREAKTPKVPKRAEAARAVVQPADKSMSSSLMDADADACHQQEPKTKQNSKTNSSVEDGAVAASKWASASAQSPKSPSGSQSSATKMEGKVATVKAKTAAHKKVAADKQSRKDKGGEPSSGLRRGLGTHQKTSDLDLPVILSKSIVHTNAYALPTPSPVCSAHYVQHAIYTCAVCYLFLRCLVCAYLFRGALSYLCLGSNAHIRLFANTLRKVQRKTKEPEAKPLQPAGSSDISAHTLLTLEQAEQLMAAFHDQDALADVTLAYILQHSVTFMQTLSTIPRLLQPPAETGSKVVYNVVSGLQGDFAQLLRVFSEEAGGFPSACNRYIFLGDVIADLGALQRGKSRVRMFEQLQSSVQCLLSLLAIQLALPSAVSILRGPNETRFLADYPAKGDGEKKEKVAKEGKMEKATQEGSSVKLRVDQKLQLLAKLFAQLPLGAVVDQSVFLAAKGVGLRSSKMSLPQLDALQRSSVCVHSRKKPGDDVAAARELIESDMEMSSKKTSKQRSSQNQLLKDFFLTNPAIKLLVVGAGNSKVDELDQRMCNKKVIKVGSYGNKEGKFAIARIEDASKGQVKIIS